MLHYLHFPKIALVASVLWIGGGWDGHSQETDLKKIDREMVRQLDSSQELIARTEALESLKRPLPETQVSLLRLVSSEDEPLAIRLLASEKMIFDEEALREASQLLDRNSNTPKELRRTLAVRLRTHASNFAEGNNEVQVVEALRAMLDDPDEN